MLCASLTHASVPATRAVAAPRRAPVRPSAALGRAAPTVAPELSPLELETGTASNIVTSPLEGQRRKLELQAQAQAALEAENGWWKDDPGAPANLVSVGSKAEYKQLIAGAPASQLVVVDYLKPSCGGCRRLYPKLKQIAAANPDALFLKVNVDLSDELREVGQGMGVEALPWFHLFVAGGLVASFSANVATVAQLRSEIAAHKPCVDAACAF